MPKSTKPKTTVTHEKELRIALWDEVKLLCEWANAFEAAELRAYMGDFRFRADELKALLERGGIYDAQN